MNWINKNFDDKEVGELKAMLIAVHGFSSSKESFMLVQLAPILKKHGIGLVALDLPGHGSRIDEKLNIKDCLDAIAKVENEVKKIYKGKISLTGSSFGGFLLLRYLHKNNNEYDRVILRAPALEQINVWKYDQSEGGRELIATLEKGQSALQGKMIVEPSLLDDFFKFDIFNHLDIDDDVKIIYGSEDTTVSNKNIIKLAEMKNWEAFCIDGADHFFRRPSDVKATGDFIIDLFS